MLARQQVIKLTEAIDRFLAYHRLFLLVLRPYHRASLVLQKTTATFVLFNLHVKYVTPCLGGL